MLHHHHFCCIRYQETQNYHYAHEKSRPPRSSSLPPQLTSNSCPMPKAVRSAPAEPRETPLTELLYNNLRSHADPAHNCLTFSDLLSAHCSAPPRLCAAPAKKKKSKQTAHAEILPKTKACLHQSQSPAPVFGCSPTLRLPFTGSLVSLARAVPRQAHAGTVQHYTEHHKQCDSRQKTLLHKKNDSLTGDAVGQGDRQGHNGPEQGGSTVAPENWIRTEWSVTRSYGQNGDDGCARSPSSRSKSIRIQERRPTVHRNGPEERRAAGTALNDAAKERCKTDPRFTLVRQEGKS